MRRFVAPLLLLFVSVLPAAAMDVAAVGDAWADLKYRDTASPDRLQRAEQLARDAAALVARLPGTAEPLFWQAQALSLTAEIIYSTKALGRMREALAVLHQAETISPDNAEVQAELGAYYYHVPGWPLGYGSNAKALQHLQRAVALAPDGRNPNYRMAEYLLGRGSKAEAIPYLKRAALPPQVGENPKVAAGLAEKARESLAKIER